MACTFNKPYLSSYAFFVSSIDSSLQFMFDTSSSTYYKVIMGDKYHLTQFIEKCPSFSIKASDFRFEIGIMPPNKNRKWKVDPYQRYLTPLENKNKIETGTKNQEKRNEKRKNLSKSKYDVNTKIPKSFEQMVGYGSIFMIPECTCVYFKFTV